VSVVPNPKWINQPGAEGAGERLKNKGGLELSDKTAGVVSSQETDVELPTA